MKGPRLIIKVFTYMALLSAVIMTVANFRPSWSQYARTLYEIPLFITLFAIAHIFLTRSFTHPDADRKLFKLFVPVRMKHSSRITGWMFFGILCTPVTIGVWWIETLHIVFTAGAIISAYSEIVNYYRSRTSRFLAWLGFGFAAFGFFAGYWFHLWTIGVGELLAALPITLHVLNTNKE